MRRSVVLCVAALCPLSPAFAVDGTLTAAATGVVGPVAAGTSVDTLTGTTSTGATVNPSLRFGLHGQVGGGLGERGDWGASWGLFRDQAFCDTCADGQAPARAGRELVSSTDLSLTAGHRFALGDAGLRLAADAALPASRDALICDPMIAAPGASATLTGPLGGGALSLRARAARPIYAFDAAPVGRCARPLVDGPVDTLAGPVSPTGWDGTRSGPANPSLSAGLSLAWTDPHALLADPGRLSSAVQIGIDASRHAGDRAVAVDTLTGPVGVDAARRPVVATVPWSLSAGWRATDAVSLSLALSNRVPGVMADPGATLRALPATTAATLSLVRTFQEKRP